MAGVPPTAAADLLAGAAIEPLTPIEHGRLWHEPFTDADGDGRYDLGEAYVDANRNAKWDGPFMAGFAQRRPATGVHDPLWARALVLELGGRAVALVAVDLVGYLLDEVERVRRDLSDLGLDAVIVSSTHTHGGVDTIGLWGPGPFVDGKDPRMMDRVRRAVAAAVRAAYAARRPAALTLARADSPIAFGRLITDTRDPIVIDQRIVALQARDRAGGVIATLVNWSPHPETVGPSNTEITSDFPHYLRQAVERGGFTVGGRRFDGAGGVALYFSGTVGGLLTTRKVDVRDETGAVLPQNSFAKAQRIGELIAAAALRAIETAPPAEPTALSASRRSLFVRLDNAMFKRMLREGVLHRTTYNRGRPAGTGGQEIQTEVGLVRLVDGGGVLAEFIAVPGELFPELYLGGLLQGDDCWRVTERKQALDGRGRERVGPAYPMVPPELPLVTRLRSAYHFILGLANDEVGYIIPRNDFVFPIWRPWPEHGKDRCGSRDHYEETASASSELAPAILTTIFELLGAAP
jgi:hypothetical protein